MPTLLLKTSIVLNQADAAKLAQSLTELTARVLGKRPEVTAVIVEAGSVTAWTVGGRAVRAPTAFLEISITEGSNSVAEKSAFVAKAYALLQSQLANEVAALEPASYVIVRELPASDWGYGGRTQQARKIARLAGAA